MIIDEKPVKGKDYKTSHVEGCQVERGLACIQLKWETIKEKETNGKGRL